MEFLELHHQFCEYCRALKNYRPSTLCGYRRTARLFHNFIGDQQLEAITPETVTAFFFHGRTQRNWATQTFLDYRKELLVFFRWCLANGYISRNPMDGLQKPRLEKRLPRNLTLEQSERLLEITRNLPYSHPFLRARDYAIVAMFIYCGLRASELLHLQFADVNLTNQVLCIREGKGAKDRVVPLPLRLIPTLREYLAERTRLSKTCPEFFASFYRNQGFTMSGLKRLVERLKVLSHIPFHVHMLRHTFATLMLEGGCDIFALSKIMGHADIKTTTIYLGVSIDHLKQAIQKHPLQSLRAGS